MSIFNSFPAIRPSLLQDFWKSQKLDPRVTFSRLSSATYFDSSGILQTAKQNEPVFEWDPATGQCLGLRIWDAVTNLVTNSATFQPSSGVNPATYVVDQVSPANTITASRQTATSPRTFTDYTGIANGSYTFSVWVKTTGAIMSTQLNLNNAVSDTTINTTYWTATSTWKRISVSGTTNGSTTGVRIEVVGVVNGIVFWGAQLNTGSVVAPYVPTGASTASSTADVASITGTAFAGIWNGTEMTIYGEGFVRAQATTTAYPRLFTAVGANTGTDEIGIYSRASIGVNDGMIFASSTTSGVIQADLIPLAGSAVNNYRSAFAFKANDFALCNNGIPPSGTAIDTSGSLPSVSEFRIYGQARFQPQPAGYIRTLCLYPSRLTNAQLVNLTS